MVAFVIEVFNEIFIGSTVLFKTLYLGVSKPSKVLLYSKPIIWRYINVEEMERIAEMEDNPLLWS